MTVSRLPSTGIFDSNIYLVSHGDDAAIVDSGTGMSVGRVLGHLRDMASGKELRAILLTHEHFDHSGGASALARELSVPVMASKECCRVLREGDEVLSGAGLFGSELEPMEGVEELGPEVRLGGLEMEVHPVPGHCRGQVSFVTKYGRALLCGDLAFCDGGVGRWDLPGGDLEELRSSLKRSLGWGVRSLHPGHGREEHHDPGRELALAWSSIRDL